MSIISASTTSTTAYKVTADTTGTLVLQTGASPTTALTIDGSQNTTLTGNITLNNGSADGAQLTLSSSGFSDWNIDNYSGNFRWYYNTTEYMRLNNSGNLGLGVTPSAWTAAYRSFDVGSWGSFYSNSTDKEIALTYNAAVLSGTGWTYKNTYPASMYQQSNGKHVWQYAASGTAGTSISWTTGMTLDASGNLGIGATGPTARLDLGTFTNSSTNQKVITATNGVNASFDVYLKTDVTTIQAGGTGNLAFSTGATPTERARIDSSGNLLVGTTSSASASVKGIQVDSTDWATTLRTSGAGGNGLCSLMQRTASTGQFIAFQYGSSGVGTGVGSISTNGSTTTYATSSDYRLKENIQPMTSALATVAQLNPVTYNWKVDDSAGQGFIAHELQAVVPDCVTGEKDAVDADGNPVYQGIDTSFLVATLTAAIKEQQAIITSLTERITALENK